MDYKTRINRKFNQEAVEDLVASAGFDNARDLAETILIESLTDAEYGEMDSEDNNAITEFIIERFRLQDYFNER